MSQRICALTNDRQVAIGYFLNNQLAKQCLEITFSALDAVVTFQDPITLKVQHKHNTEFFVLLPIDLIETPQHL